MSSKPTKDCVVCGRPMEWRKAWAKNWDEVKYCSDRCRKQKKSSGFETQILELLSKRSKDSTICPSEILPNEDKQNKELMEQVRQAARKLSSAGKIEITQKGQVVFNDFKGPIRLRLKR